MNSPFTVLLQQHSGEWAVGVDNWAALKIEDDTFTVISRFGSLCLSHTRNFSLILPLSLTLMRLYTALYGFLLLLLCGFIRLYTASLSYSYAALYGFSLFFSLILPPYRRLVIALSFTPSLSHTRYFSPIPTSILLPKATL